MTRMVWLVIALLMTLGLALVSADSKEMRISRRANLSTVLSNVPNDSIVRLGSGVFPVVPTMVFSNGLGGINLFNKTNLTIEGVPGETVIDGRSDLGEVLLITNCSHVVLRGLTVLGRVETNYTLAAGIGHVWGSVGIYACENLTVEGCRFIDGHDHGIHDLGAQPGWNLISTNEIVIRGNYFENFGSARSNETTVVDGTAVVPTGWLVESNEFQACLRCVEPYSEGDEVPNLFFNCVIRGNRMINTLDAAILTAGSTNGQNLRIEGNYISNDVGYSRRGTNIHGQYAIFLNAGNGHVVRGNQIVNPSYMGIALGGGSLAMADVVVEGNTISDVTSDRQGIGIQTYCSAGPELRNIQIKSNLITRTLNCGMQLLSLRDSLVQDNVLIDPCLVSEPGVAIQLAAVGVVYHTNVMIRQNQITDLTGAMVSGIAVHAGSRSIQLRDNCISGGTAGPLTNSAGGETIFSNRGYGCAPVLRPVVINEWKRKVSHDSNDETDDAGDGGGDEAEDSSWFEIYNPSNFSVDLGGYSLSDELEEPSKFFVPDDGRQILPPGGFMVVFADGRSFPYVSGSWSIHAPFEIDSADGGIGVFANGHPIDYLTFTGLPQDVSEARFPDGSGRRYYFEQSTPGAVNSGSVLPRLLEVEMAPGVNMKFRTVAGLRYQVEYADDLSLGMWAALGDAWTAAGAVGQFTDAARTNSTGFYRIKVLAD